MFYTNFLTLFLALFSTILNAQAQEEKSFEPGMPLMMIKDSLESSQKGGSNHCEDSSQNFAFSGLQDEESFQTTLHCQLQCEQEEMQARPLSRTFSANKVGLQRGDGNLWASTTTTLVYWAQEHCLKAAVDSCGGAEKISMLNVDSIESGDWKFSGKVSCQKDQPSILSPFDSQAHVKRPLRSREHQKTSVEKLALRYDWDQSFRSFGRVEKDESACDSYLTGTFCYGDCIDLESKDTMTELLASGSPLGEDQVKVCADELIKDLSQYNFSDDVKNHYCETYFLSKLKAKGTLGLTCASSRFDLDCSAISSGR